VQYEGRLCRGFVVCATGNTAESRLAVLWQRHANTNRRSMMTDRGGTPAPWTRRVHIGNWPLGPTDRRCCPVRHRLLVRCENPDRSREVAATEPARSGGGTADGGGTGPLLAQPVEIGAGPLHKIGPYLTSADGIGVRGFQTPTLRANAKDRQGFQTPTLRANAKDRQCASRSSPPRYSNPFALRAHESRIGCSREALGTGKAWRRSAAPQLKFAADRQSARAEFNEK